MCIISKEINRSPNTSPINNPSSLVIFNTPKLSSGSSCIVSSVEENYVDKNKELVDKFINQRNIKAEIDFPSKRYISNGAFGQVSIANLTNGSKVAIKEFKAHKYKEYYEDKLISTRIRNEAANCINLNGNPRFVELLGIYINDTNNPCLSMAMVMEYADGDLTAYESALVKNKDVNLSYENMRYIALEFCHIVEACKTAKINYPDFHSGNVLVFYKGKRLKLADFDGIRPFINSHELTYESLFELLEFSCANYGKYKHELLYIKRSTIFDREHFKHNISYLLGGDDILANIILEPIMAYKKQRSQKKPNALEKMIDQLKSCELEEFPELKMTWG